jgi:hypothetical protein
MMMHRTCLLASTLCGVFLVSTSSADCPADLDGDGVVGGPDLAMLLGEWGGSGSGTDLDGNGVVDGGDLASLLSLWGPCLDTSPCFAGETLVYAAHAGGAAGGTLEHPEDSAIEYLPGVDCDSELPFTGMLDNITVTIEQYDVVGLHLHQVCFDMLDPVYGMGPTDSTGRYAAYTYGKLQPIVKCHEIGIEVDGPSTFPAWFDLKGQVTILMPRWVPPTGAHPDAIAEWDRFLSELLTHEYEHAALFDAMIGQMKSTHQCDSELGICLPTFGLPTTELGTCPVYSYASLVDGTGGTAEFVAATVLANLKSSAAYAAMVAAQLALDASGHGPVLDCSVP